LLGRWLPLAGGCQHLAVVLAGELAGEVRVCGHGFLLPVRLAGWSGAHPIGSPGRPCAGQMPDYPFSPVRALWVQLPTRRWRPGRSRGPLEESGLQGQAGQVGAAPAAGLVPDPVQMGADGAHADVQIGGDLGVGAALGDLGD
jgi:hypothetical protein